MKIIALSATGILKASFKFLGTTLCISASVFTAGHAQTISGGSLVIGSGAVISSNNDLFIQSGASLDVQGTLILKKNLSNQNATANSLGTGLIEVSGSTTQTISGLNIIANLTMNNPEGLTVGGNTRLTGALALTSGRITLGTNNLTLGPAATVSGTPSAANMVVATGTGELRKEFIATGSFTYPVGDNTSTAEYSPVTLNFSSGTFGSDAYAGVNLVNAKYPDANITTSYLNRYWKVTQSGITGFACTTTFTYADADISGTEGDLFCVKADPVPYITYGAVNAGSNLLTATGLGSFSTFTGAMGSHELSLIAFLEGPYNAGSMNTTLRAGGLLPLTQPYNTTPWNYTGTETVASIPAGVVDWILIELRQADQPANATSGTIIKKRAAFIKSDGTIVDTDGTSAVRFYNSNITQNLYPVVRHRNHLAIMAANTVSKTGGVYTYDFSTGIGQAYGGGSGYKQIPGTTPAVYGMVAGDIDQNGSVYVPDYTIWASNQGTAGVYYNADLDFDGNVYVPDYTKWAANQGTSNPILMPNKPKFVTAVP